MTSEVCLMNRHAAVLAADSATTVTSWTGGERETRYFKGANKILQLSNHHPVGIMTFDSADVLDVPWEVVVKTFRAELKDKSFNSIEGYAQEFFNFLERDARLFPADVQKAQVFRAARVYAYLLAVQVRDQHGGDPADLPNLFDHRVGVERQELDQKQLPDGLVPAEADLTVAAWLPEMVEQLNGYLDDSVPRPNDLGPLAELGLWSVLKEPKARLDTTGLVFAGFGDHDVFPSHVHYTSCGVVGGKHIAVEEGRAEITHDIPADLSAFAQRSMIDTFQLGLDHSVFSDGMACFADALREIVGKVIDESGGDAAKIADLEAILRAARQSVVDKWLDGARAKHAFPLRRVLASLPINEMADLAETLVNLQSLKEKVTKPSEEVGGPVDVAAITKSDGLIWIRRKHYFDPALNARYMARLSAAYQ